MRNHFIDFMRGVAALGVLVCHTSRAVISFYPNSWLNSSSFLKSFFEHGRIGVDIFFLISGYIIFISVNRNSSPRVFLAKRLTRIFVPYLPLAILLGLVYLMFPGLTNSPNGISVNWIKSLTLIPATGDYSLSIAWTLSYEVFFYIIVCLTLFLRLNAARWLIVLFPSMAGLVAILCGRPIEFNKATDFAELFLSPYQWEFLIGCISAWAGQALISQFSALRNEKRILSTIFILAVAIVIFPFDLNLRYRIILMVFLGTLLALSSVRDFSFARKRLRLITVAGTFSYSLYLVHVPVQSVIVRLSLLLKLPVELLLVILIAVPVICSIEYFYLIERHSLALMKQIEKSMK